MIKVKFLIIPSEIQSQSQSHLARGSSLMAIRMTLRYQATYLFCLVTLKATGTANSIDPDSEEAIVGRSHEPNHRGAWCGRVLPAPTRTTETKADQHGDSLPLETCPKT